MEIGESPIKYKVRDIINDHICFSYFKERPEIWTATAISIFEQYVKIMGLSHFTKDLTQHFTKTLLGIIHCTCCENIVTYCECCGKFFDFCRSCQGLVDFLYKHPAHTNEVCKECYNQK